jgi:hypothetical protein
MSLRIKGQEVELNVTRGGALEDSLTDIRSFDLELQYDLKQEGYLGQTTDMYDDVFKGVKFNMELHLHTQEWLTFLKALEDRSRRVTPDVVFSITGTFSFPNGDTPILTLNDVKFANVPHNVPSRGDYVSVKLSGGCSELDVQKS